MKRTPHGSSWPFARAVCPVIVILRCWCAYECLWCLALASLSSNSLEPVGRMALPYPSQSSSVSCPVNSAIESCICIDPTANLTQVLPFFDGAVCLSSKSFPPCSPSIALESLLAALTMTRPPASLIVPTKRVATPLVRVRYARQASVRLPFPLPPSRLCWNHHLRRPGRHC